MKERVTAYRRQHHDTKGASSRGASGDSFLLSPPPKVNIITNWHPCSLLDVMRFDKPKSMILITGSAPFVASMRFWGFMSRCITFIDCMYAKPDITWRSAVRDRATHRSGEAVHNQSMSQSVRLYSTTQVHLFGIYQVGVFHEDDF